MAPVLIQQVAALSKDIQEEARLSTQVEDIEDKVKAIFKALSKTAEDKTDKVNKTKLPELSAEEVARMDLPTIPTTWEPMAAVPELDFKVVNLPKELIFAVQHTSEFIYSFSTGVKYINFSTQDKDSEYLTYYTLAD